jgi:hypothetical protein
MKRGRGKRSSKKVSMMKSADSSNDPVLKEFEERDLGDDIRASGAGVMIRKQQPTSILLSDELKEALRKRGKELGVGYQTAAKMILAKYVNAKL